MFIDPVLLSLGCAAYASAVTATNVFVYDITSLKRRHDIFVDCRKIRFGEKYQSKFCRNYHSFDLFLEFRT